MKSMQLRIFFLFSCVILLVAGLSAAGARFSGLDLGDRGDLVFSARVDAPRYGEYRASFQADLASSTIMPLTFFPEAFSWLAATGEIQISNRFGVFRGKEGGKLLEPLKGYPGFLSGGEIRRGRIGAVQTSPDGSWLAYIKQTSPAYGDIVVLDVMTSREQLVSRHVELSLQELPVLWSPDSGVLVYQKGTQLYHLAFERNRRSRVLDEEMRRIGPGRISSVRWGRNNQLVYLKGNMVYEILGSELLTRSLYREILKYGRILGTIPQQFDPVTDRFWLSPDGDRLLLDKGGNNVYFYLLGDPATAETRVVQLPYLIIPGNMRISDLIWNPAGQVTFLLGNHARGDGVNRICRINTRDGLSEYRFESLDAPGVRMLRQSPDGALAALVTPDGVEIRNQSDWALQFSLPHPDPLHVVFTDSDRFLVAGRWYGESIQLPRGKGQKPVSQFLFFSQAEECGHGQSDGATACRSRERIMTLGGSRPVWFPLESLALRPPRTAAGPVRAYLEQVNSGPYENMVMLRRTDAPGTRSLFQPPSATWEDFPAAGGDAPEPEGYVTHGSRQRTRKIALTVNAIDSVDGLESMLTVLSEYRVRATFFLNGEFIRRYPWAAREIAEAGHEVGNLFYQYFNLSDARYRIDEDFIKQGISRNEMDYFQITGKELSLEWRSPYYLVNDLVLRAGRSLGYTMVGRDVDTLDYVTRGGLSGASELYRPASDLVEMVLERKKPGSIIAMTLGRPGMDEDSSLGREDYLYERLDVLINGLLGKGYSLVPVSEIIEEAQ